MAKKKPSLYLCFSCSHEYKSPVKHKQKWKYVQNVDILQLLENMKKKYKKIYNPKDCWHEPYFIEKDWLIYHNTACQLSELDYERMCFPKKPFHTDLEMVNRIREE